MGTNKIISDMFAQIKATKKRKGFTLTELLIWPKGHLRVLLIMGILASIAIAEYSKYITKVWDLW